MIIYYAHSHGSGHCNYARQFSQSMEECIIATDSSYNFPKSCELLHLENEHVPDDHQRLQTAETPNYLHHSPVGLKKILRRSADLLLTAISREVKLVMVDVSVEIAALCRVSSLPYAYRRMPGNRNDTAHEEAYRGAAFLFAYYPQEFEDDDTPEWIKNKTIYAGFITDKKPTVRCYDPARDMHRILVVQGSGGHSFDSKAYRSLRNDFPRSIISTLGRYDFGHMDDLHNDYGYVDDISPYVNEANLVVAGCGSNTVSELLSLNKKFIALPEKRPYAEQLCIANALEKNQLAVQLRNKDFLAAASRLEDLPHDIPREFKPRAMSHFCSQVQQKIKEFPTSDHRQNGQLKTKKPINYEQLNHHSP